MEGLGLARAELAVGLGMLIRRLSSLVPTRALLMALLSNCVMTTSYNLKIKFTTFELNA